MRRHIATIMVGLACLVVLAVGAVLIYEFLKDIDTKKLDIPTKTTTESHVVVTLGTKSPILDAMSSNGKHESSSIWSSGQPVISASPIKNSSGNKTTATASPDKTSSTERATTAASSVMTRIHERSSTGSSGQPPTSVIQTYSPPAKETTATQSSPEQTTSTKRPTTAALFTLSSTMDRSTTAVTSPETEQYGNSSVLTSSSAHPSKTAQPLTTSQPMTTSSTNSNFNANETTTETTTFSSNQDKSTEAASTSAEQLKETDSTSDAFTTITITSSILRGNSESSTRTRMPIEDLFPGQPLHALWEDSQRDSD